MLIHFYGLKENKRNYKFGLTQRMKNARNDKYILKGTFTWHRILCWQFLSLI